MAVVTVLWYGFWAGMIGAILGLMAYDYARARWLSFLHTRALRRRWPCRGAQYDEGVQPQTVFSHRQFRDRQQRKSCAD